MKITNKKNLPAGYMKFLKPRESATDMGKLTATKMQEKLKTIWEHFGSRKQVLKTIEELNEFSASLSRFLNDDKGYFGVYEEFADVEIMLEQLKFLFDVEVINEKKTKKIERTLKRIENCYYK